MRFNTFRYLVKEGCRSLRSNFFMSAASVLVLISCLLITGCSYLVFQNVEHGFDWAYQQNVVVAYAKGEITPEQANALAEQIKKLDNVNAVDYVSKEALLDRYQNEFGDLLEDLKNDNPLQDAYVVSLVDLSKFESTVSQIRTLDGIDTVDYNTELTKTLTKARNLVMTVGMWIIGLLLLVSLFIIANTIKLTVYSRRLEIYIMRSVGATHWFIRFPFMVEGIILGFFAGSLSYVILYGIYEAVKRFFTFGSGFQLISFSYVWWQLLLGFIVGGMVVGLLGSAISMGRYLKENKD